MVCSSRASSNIDTRPNSSIGRLLSISNHTPQTLTKLRQLTQAQRRVQLISQPLGTRRIRFHSKSISRSFNTNTGHTATPIAGKHITQVMSDRGHLLNQTRPIPHTTLPTRRMSTFPIRAKLQTAESASMSIKTKLSLTGLTTVKLKISPCTTM